ncbi:Probable amino acid ABC transporter%2C permease [Mycobacteroides abscessus]|uniref:Probable amino acid ABC transporter, permease n=1 Tax=Mycobacteroides abscessus subsp. abscessus TaxID=1185650 RepID=A0AB38D248_9MYCO|nr:Probable amino acid ABC transporter%2C permease [Mycobacteroides abscessus]SHP66303.1 Probable amino acid ABC transporter, permease [Mycobacteroides abscessus subsp. abscessus]CPS40524.1 Probable amino acid ABC transporter%2C permease [Mycobacteroides abscessus]CPT17657.1 Probable amino acid ABC transporter%2C permease [Mycobacteroides abscessus]CPU38047.1 Probable amino acid ABC transporter%2C permease [Mycobacteroides abscessus]
MFRAIVLALLALVAVAGCAAPTQEPLRVGTEGVYAPFSFHDGHTGELTGYDVDVARAVGEKLGRPVEFVEIPWDAIFAGLDAERFDVVANQVTITPARKAKYDISTPYAVGEGVIVTRADDNSIHSLSDVRGKVAAENATSNWSQIARDAGARVEAVEGFTQSITLLSQGRVDVVINDSIAVYAYLASTGDPAVKIAGATGQRSEQGFAARKNSGLLPDLDKALDQLAADGTLTRISQKYLKTDASGTTKPQAGKEDSGSTRSDTQLVLDNLWPMARAMLTVTLPLTAISFVIGLVIALGVALARMSGHRVVTGLARIYISVIRGTPLLLQLFLIFFALPEFGVKISPFPAAVIAFSLNVGGYAAEIIRSSILSIPRGQWEAASSLGMSYSTTLWRIVIPQASRVAVPPPVEHLDLPGEGHLAGLGDPGDGRDAYGTGRRRADLSVLHALRHRRRLLLDCLHGDVGGAGPAGAASGEIRRALTLQRRHAVFRSKRREPRAEHGVSAASRRCSPEARQARAV